jgi:hypothetical protein
LVWLSATTGLLSESYLEMGMGVIAIGIFQVESLGLRDYKERWRAVNPRAAFFPTNRG